MRSESVVREFQRLLEPGTVAGLTGRQVLERFAERGDPVAFEAIVTRHGLHGLPADAPRPKRRG
jgi:hypothetical protein